MIIMENFTIYRSQFIDKPRDVVFSFFSKPENLEYITPPYLHFKIMNTLPVSMKEGQIINYKLRIRGISIKWSSLIKSYSPPFNFIDEQIKGPYSVWHHTHEFIEEKNGTRIIDNIIYKIPLGFIGKLINHFWVAKDLEKIFNYRQDKVNEFFKNKEDGSI